MSAERGTFICQSQSLNLFMEDATLGKFSSMHFYSWLSGLKTRMYYIKTKAAADLIKFTLSDKHQRKFVDHTTAKEAADLIPKTQANIQTVVAISKMLQATEEIKIIEGEICSMEDGCLMCGSSEIRFQNIYSSKLEIIWRFFLAF